MIYRVSIDTSSARREAANIRAVLERELKQIRIDPAIFQASTAEALKLRDAINQIETEAKQAQTALGNVRVPAAGSSSGVIPTSAISSAPVLPNGNDVDSVAGGVRSLALSYLSLQAAMAGVSKLVDLAELGTSAARAGKSFEILSGSAEKAQANVIAIQRASSGTISSMTAMQLGTQAAALGLASTTAEFERLVAAARLIVQVSPTIKDLGDAMGQLALFASNETSYMRADQLGLAASEVKDRIKELQSENENLTGSEAKLEASLQIITEKFGALTSTAEAQATGIEKLRVSWTEFQIALSGGTGPVQAIANSLSDGFNELTVLIAGTDAPIGVLLGNLDRLYAESKRQADINSQWELLSKGAEFLTGESVGAGAQRIAMVGDALRSAVSAVEEGIPGSGKILGQIQVIATEVDKWNGATTEQIALVQQLSTELNNLITNGGKAQATAITAAESARLAEQQRVDLVFEQTDPIQQDLFKQAKDSMGDLGVDRAVELYKQERAKVDAALQELADTGVTDADEIKLRAIDIMAGFSEVFSGEAAMVPEVDPGVTAESFNVISEALAEINQGFVDFLPSTAAARDELISLNEEIAFTGVVTDEQAARLDYLSGAAAAVGDETGLLAAVTDELGIAFLSSNEGAASTVDAMYQAQTAYLAGQLTAEQYAGIIATLGGQLLAYAQQAGVATGATLALISAQGGLANLAGFSQGQMMGGGIVQRIKTQEDARAREEARKAALRAAKEAESAAKRAAREQEAAAKRAGKELESAAKKAAQELKSALDKVPGLFSRSQVTEGDMKLSKAGVYLDKADEKLRRLQAEVEQGKDLFGDISIGEAKQSLIDLGVQVAEDEKVAFQQFADAWESGLLFFDPANIEKYINEEAVQRDLDLQKKAAEGKDNIYKAFGVAIDDAVDAAVGGISGGGGGASGGVADLQIPITATLEPIPPITETPTVPVQPYISPTAWKQIEMPPLSMPIQSQVTGTQANAGATTGLFDVTAIQAQLDTLKFPQFDATAMGLADLQAQIDGLTTKVEITATLSPDAGTTIASDLADQLATQVATFKSQGGTIGDILLAGIGESFNVIQGDKVVDTGVADSIIASIGAQLGAKVKTLEGVGAGVGQIVKAGIANDMGTVQWADGEIVAPIANGLITAISTQVRGTTEGFKREGASIAQLVMAGLSSGLSGVSAEGTQSADLAFVLAGAINSQFSTNANFFYAAGQPVATDVMSGYKSMFSGNTEGAPLVTPMITAINTQIRMQGESLQNQGITMAQYVQNGFTTAFNGEAFKGAIIAAGETMGAYLEIGILSRIRGGALVEAIGAQVLADITAEVEAP